MSTPARAPSALARLERLRRELGTRELLLYALHRALETVSGGRARLVRYRFVAQPLGRPGGTVLRPDAATRLALEPPDGALVPQFPRPPEVIQARYRHGAQCLAATVKGEFAGYIWWQHGQYEEDEVRCRYVLGDAAHCVWDFDVYVVPRLRLGRTMARLWQAVDEQLSAQGVQWSLSRISTFNPGSLSSHARLGTVDCGTATFVVLGGLQLAFLDRAPFVHLSWHADSRPTVTLAAPPQLP